MLRALHLRMPGAHRRAGALTALWALSAFLSFCIYSCADYPTDTSGRNLFEMESVWQYLKTYSFWQDNVPPNAFIYATPQEMMTSINDTLKAIPYTGYDYGDHSSSTPSVTVGWNSLSDSTALVQIILFSEKDSSTYFQFLNILPSLAPYRNIIFDLIGNPGGGIAPTDAIINAILPVNRPYIMETYRKYDYGSRTESTVPWNAVATTNGQNPALHNKRYAVLFGKGTASAAEIFVAAMKDGLPASLGDTAVFVGDTSYGKGIGQVVITRFHRNMPEIKITFMRMKGISARVGDYFRKGIAPDTLVPITEADPLHRAQINAALKFLQPSIHLSQGPALLKTVSPPGYFPPEAVVVEKGGN